MATDRQHHNHNSNIINKAEYPIQRLLLLHFGLREISTGNAVAEEAFSLEELALSILYNYESKSFSPQNQQQQHQDSSNENDYDDDIIMRSIHLCNLASALYTLPSALFPDEQDDGDDDDDKNKNFQNDKVHKVELERAILMFQPVENDDNIVLLIQVAKPNHVSADYKNNSSSTKAAFARAVTPEAVAQALARHHMLFCLLQQGGIHCRLQQVVPETRFSTCLYPGMDELYRRLKQKRKLQQQFERQLQQQQQNRFHNNNKMVDNMDSSNHRHQDTDAAVAAQRELQQLQASIRQFRQVLPLHAIKRDLKVHYDSFLREWHPIPGSGRCLVEHVPVPPPPAAAAAADFWHVQNPKGLQLLSQALEQVISVAAQSSSNSCYYGSSTSSPILRASMYLRHDHSCLWTVPTVTTTTSRLQQERSALLLSYMAQLDARASAIRHPPTSPSASSSSPMGNKTSTWSPSFWMATMTTQMGPQSNPSNNNVESFNNKNGRFVPPPPLSVLGVGQTAQGLSYRRRRLCHHSSGSEAGELVQVWAPRVYGTTSDDKLPAAPCRACLYHYGEHLQLLLLLAEPQPNDEDESAYFQALFSALDGFFQSSLPRLLDSDNDDVDESNKKVSWLERRTWNELGQDILLIHRGTNQVVLYSSSSTTAKSGNNLSDDSKSRTLEGKSPSRGSKQINDKSEEAQSANGAPSQQAIPLLLDHKKPSPNNGYAATATASTTTTTSKRPYFFTGDARHDLARHFRSLDTLLAVEEAMMEFASSSSASAGAKDQELCTLLKRDWLWASRRADDGVELYVVLDAARYVTIADVEAAIKRIQTDFFRPLFEGVP